MPVDSFAVIVNDDQSQLAVLAGLARKACLEPQFFTDAESARASMMSLVREKETLPAIVVTDLNMPGIDGWHFCRLLRSREYFPLNNIPIVIVSAIFSGDEPASIADALGVEGFLPILSEPAGGDVLSGVLPDGNTPGCSVDPQKTSSRAGCASRLERRDAGKYVVDRCHKVAVGPSRFSRFFEN
jgi:CheY-like chemotaxis protein